MRQNTITNTRVHDDDRDTAERMIRESLETLAQIGVSINNYKSADEGILQRRVEKLVRSYSDIHAIKDKLDVNIPLEVLSFIEDGRNPDEFTRNFTERVAAENQFTNGKITALSNFKNEFEDNLREFFPEEANERLSTTNPVKDTKPKTDEPSQAAS